MTAEAHQVPFGTVHQISKPSYITLHRQEDPESEVNYASE
jgi:hypothetical protein